ncbi:MAG: Maff2 family protein [Oscillospiraceae bacterium]|nr:Maff2 family protein [Oscillospiraceae bacterium]
MDFFYKAIDVLVTIVTLIGGGLAAWGVVNLLEGYGNDNPGAKSQGIKQLMAGVGIAIIALLLIPQLKTLF